MRRVAANFEAASEGLGSMEQALRDLLLKIVSSGVTSLG
jgi:hypothetical protein